jgi:hypothetical protein
MRDGEAGRLGEAGWGAGSPSLAAPDAAASRAAAAQDAVAGVAPQPAAGDCRAAIDAVATAVDRFAGRPRGDRPGEVIRDEMMVWRRLIDRMELEFAGMVTELTCRRRGRVGGHTSSPTAWVKEECHTTGTAAWNALVVGQQAARMTASTRRSCAMARSATPTSP